MNCEYRREGKYKPYIHKRMYNGKKDNAHNSEDHCGAHQNQYVSEIKLPTGSFFFWARDAYGGDHCPQNTRQEVGLHSTHGKTYTLT